MAEDKVRTSIYLTPDTWDRLVFFIREVHGRDAKAVSITIEAALREYLDNHAKKTPA